MMRSFYSRHKCILNAVILALLPIIACLIKTLSAGKGICDVYLGAGQWNDELFYFKQVEGMVSHKIPMGYFGYNESCASTLSFGAWNPVILLPWALWGKIFGWNIMSPIISNIVYLTIAMFLFGLLAKPGLIETISLSLLLLIITPLARYMLSGMPEIVCISLLVVYMGLILGYETGKKVLRFSLAAIILLALTIMRPYYAVFFAFMFFVPKTGEKIAKIISVVLALAGVFVSLKISDIYCAPYLSDVYSTDIIANFKNFGFGYGISTLFKEIVHYLGAIASASAGAFLNKYPIGIYFAAFMLQVVLLVILLFAAEKKNRKNVVSMLICDVAMLMAIVLMYSMGDGFRHLLAFIVAGGVILSLYSDKKKITVAACALVYIILFIINGTDATYFRPYYDYAEDAPSRAKVETLAGDLAKMELTAGPSFDNTVCLVLADPKSDFDGSYNTKWQYAYGLPKGFGISYCTFDYVSENINSLKSKYVYVVTGGTIEKMLPKTSECIAANDDVSVYKLR